MIVIKTAKLKNAINFYMLANNLKYIPNDDNSEQSVADFVYGAMILAISINSEYKRVDNLGATLRIILFSAINKFYHKELVSCFGVMNRGEKYSREFLKYLVYDSLDNSDNNEGRLVFDCEKAEHVMTSFFEKILKEENITSQNLDELYQEARNHGILDYFGDDEKKNYEIFRFYYLNRTLKTKVRSGWDSKHWNVSSGRIEKVAEHVVGSMALAIGLDSEFNFKINLDKILSTLCIHEIGEISIGDITPFDGITPEQKLEIEHKAMIEIIGNLSNNEKMTNWLFEFDEQQTSEAKFSHYCDKLEADIQAKIYQDRGYQHPLTEQQNNVVLKSSKVQKIIENGAKDVFDIWYEYDKPIYSESPIFTKMLKYVKNTNLNK